MPQNNNDLVWGSTNGCSQIVNVSGFVDGWSLSQLLNSVEEVRKPQADK